MHFVKVIANRVYGLLLVIAVGDFVFDAEVLHRAPSTALEDQLKVILGENTKDTAGRIAQTVNYLRGEAIRDVNYWTHTVLGLQAICIEFCLLLSGFGVNRCAFGLNDRQRLPVRGKENVVCITDALLIGHALQFHFDAGFAGSHHALLLHNLPSGFLNEKVDEQFAGFGLGVIIGNDGCRGRILHGLSRNRGYKCCRSDRHFFARNDMYGGLVVQEFPVEWCKRR